MNVTPPLPPPPIESWEVLDLLTSLVQKSLVVYEEDEQGRGRYRLLETVRQYGRDRLLEAGEGATVRGRHRDWFLALVEQAEPALHGPEQMTRLEQLEVEHDNLRAALDGCQGDEHGTDAALRLVGALPWFWFQRGHLVEGRQRVEGALAAGHEAAPALRAKALNAGSLVAYCLGDYGAMGSLDEAALALWQQRGDKRGIAVSLVGLGLGTVSQGDFERAQAFLEDGLRLSRQIGDQWLSAYALVIRGEVFRLQGDYREAIACYEESLALLRQVGDKWVTALALQNAGQVAQYQGDWEHATALHREGVRLCHELNERAILAGGLERLAGVAVGQGQPGRAARLLGAAEALREAVNAPVEAMDRPDYDRSVAATRAALDDEAFAAAWAEGRALSLEEAVSYALEMGTERRL